MLIVYTSVSHWVGGRLEQSRNTLILRGLASLGGSDL
jgi:hypothetical protein